MSHFCILLSRVALFSEVFTNPLDLNTVSAGALYWLLRLEPDVVASASVSGWSVLANRALIMDKSGICFDIVEIEGVDSVIAPDCPVCTLR